MRFLICKNNIFFLVISFCWLSLCIFAQWFFNRKKIAVIRKKILFCLLMNIVMVVSILKKVSIVGIFGLLLVGQGFAKEPKMNTIKVSNARQMREYFAYNSSRAIVVSGHRGGMSAGYPENCIESFEKTLTIIESFFEIDPRLTKDSVIVLMHDSSLDRTTTGKGKVADYTYEELQQLRLKDRDGNVTSYKIPTLEEAIKWSGGRTILNLDKKNVPLEMTATLIRKLKASNVMLTVHSAKEALYYYEQNPEAMFSAFIRTMDEYRDYEKSGIPWSSFMAYVGPTMVDEHLELYKLLRSKGVMCMISTSPSHDKLALSGERKVGYEAEIAKRPDVIETDYPSEFVELDLSK